VEGLGDAGLRERHQLTEPHRFSTTSGIFLAARALREGSRLAGQTVPFYFGQTAPAAWRIMERLVLGRNGPRWTGTTAMISPSGGALDTVLRSLAGQIAKGGHRPIHWTRQAPSEDEQASLHEVLGVSGDHLDEADWQPKTELTNPHASEVIDRAYRFARLRGLKRIPKHLISSLVEHVIHEARAHSRSSARFVATTVHGAKNCQFDNVCVLWSYQIPGDPELQRRLLYNAVTRAKTNCIVFDTRKKDVAANDPIVTLLGDLKPIFEKRTRPKKASQKTKTRGGRRPER
jgi:hypothetical protein